MSIIYLLWETIKIKHPVFLFLTSGAQYPNPPRWCGHPYKMTGCATVIEPTTACFRWTLSPAPRVCWSGPREAQSTYKLAAETRVGSRGTKSSIRRMGGGPHMTNCQKAYQNSSSLHLNHVCLVKSKSIFYEQIGGKRLKLVPRKK